MTASTVETSRPRAKGRLLKVFGLKPRARVPEGMRVYAIGDIHGCSHLLDLLHEKIARDAKKFRGEKIVVYLGDFIDRGHDSKGVVERLLHAVPAGMQAHYIKGNHDAALLAFLVDPGTYRVWRNFGAAETLQSYGVSAPLFDAMDQFEAARVALSQALPREHLAFFNNLALKVEIGDYMFCHAGVRPGVAIDEQCEEDLLWIREEFLNSNLAFGKVVVHGHTPLLAPVRTANRISVDTGAYATGTLSAAVLERKRCRFLQAKARS